MTPTPDALNPLGVLTTRELLVNRAMARRRMKASSTALSARIDAELERRRRLKADRLFGDVPPIGALDETRERR